MNGHWTSRSVKDFVFRISSDFTFQIEKKMEELPITRSELAEKIGVSNGRVSQVLGNPGNMTIGKMVEYAKGVGMKVAIVAYEDGDPENKKGPVNSQIFAMCWKKFGKPTDFFMFRDNADALPVQTRLIIRYIERPLDFGASGISNGQLTKNIEWYDKHGTGSENISYGVQ